MSLNACWSRPIAVLDGNERQALRTFSARKPRLPAHSRASLTSFSRTARMLLTPFVETDCVFAAPLTFPFMGVKFRHTLRVSREISLTMPDNQQQLGECMLFPRTTCGLGLLLLLMHDSTTCVWHVCCIQALFGALVQTSVSLVPTALGSETHQTPREFEKHSQEQASCTDGPPPAPWGSTLLCPCFPGKNPMSPCFLWFPLVSSPNCKGYYHLFGSWPNVCRKEEPRSQKHSPRRMEPTGAEHETIEPRDSSREPATAHSPQEPNRRVSVLPKPEHSSQV